MAHSGYKNWFLIQHAEQNQFKLTFTNQVRVRVRGGVRPGPRSQCNNGSQVRWRLEPSPMHFLASAMAACRLSFIRVRVTLIF